jgi:hypothetical protein
MEVPWKVDSMEQMHGQRMRQCLIAQMMSVAMMLLIVTGTMNHDYRLWACKWQMCVSCLQGAEIHSENVRLLM